MYSPSNFTASNGTTVTFFFPSYDSYHCCPFVMLMHAICRGSIAHSVTEGSFANPCVYLAAAGGNPAGFDSGLQTAKEFTIQITNDQERMQNILSFLLSCSVTISRDSRLVLLQKHGPLWSRNGWVSATSELLHSMLSITMFFVARSMRRPPEILMLRSWLLRRLSARAKFPWVAPSLTSFQRTYNFSDDFQLSDTGPVTGGVGAQATATPGPTTATPSSSSTSSTSSSPASRLVANGLVALLAAAFGITLA